MEEAEERARPATGVIDAPIADEPWRRDAAEVAADLGTDLRVGLTSAEAAARLERFGPNLLDPLAQDIIARVSGSEAGFGPE